MNLKGYLQEEYTMEAKMNKIDTNVVELEIKVDAKDFNEALKSLIIKTQRSLTYQDSEKEKFQ